MASNDSNGNERYLNALAEKSRNGDDTAFMEIIKEFSCLYNRSSAQFKDKNLKINSWKKIAALHTIEGVHETDVLSTCKQIYESIRTSFSRYLKRSKPPSGSGSDDVVLDPKYEHLRWLVTFIKARSSSSNIDSLGAPEDYSQTLGADQEQVGRNEENPEEQAEDTCCEDENFLTDETTPRFVKSSIY